MNWEANYIECDRCKEPFEEQELHFAESAWCDCEDEFSCGHGLCAGCIEYIEWQDANEQSEELGDEF